MCQSTYMHETEPFDYAPEAASQVQVVVKDMVGAALDVIRGL
jgi:N-formylglutamate deformylase